MKLKIQAELELVCGSAETHLANMVSGGRVADSSFLNFLRNVDDLNDYLRSCWFKPRLFEDVNLRTLWCVRITEPVEALDFDHVDTSEGR